MNKVIVFVDDEAAIVNAFEMYFSIFFKDSKIVCFSDPVMAFDYCVTHPVDVLVTDVNMPELNGFELIKKVRETGLTPSVVIVSGFYSSEHQESFSALGDFSFFTKPVLLKDLAFKIKEKIGA